MVLYKLAAAKLDIERTFACTCKRLHITLGYLDLTKTRISLTIKRIYSEDYFLTCI